MRVQSFKGHVETPGRHIPASLRPEGAGARAKQPREPRRQPGAKRIGEALGDPLAFVRLRQVRRELLGCQKNIISSRR